MDDFYLDLETTYSENGYYLQSETIYDENGVIEEKISFIYDSKGNLIKETYEEDDNADGVVDEIYINSYEYDANNYLIKETEAEDENVDGVIDYSFTYTYEYDDNGYLIKETYIEGEDDEDNEIETYTYDANGNLIKETEDEGADGTIDEIETYTYDTNGNLIKETEEEDINDDGVFEQTAIATYIYDANGNLLEETYQADEDEDGEIDYAYSYIYEYDANGNLIKETEDDDGDGDIDYVYTYAYDDNGKRIQSTEADRDGVILELSTYTRDAEGRLIERTDDEGNDGVIDHTTTRAYDTNGNLVAESFISHDTNFSDEVDRTTTISYSYTFDDDNNLIKDVYEFSSSYRNSSNTRTYTYDSEGNLTEETYDRLSDGTIDERTVYSYDSATNLGIEPTESPSLSLSEVHRFYQREKGFHFYSSDANEINTIKDKSSAGELAYDYEQEQYQVLTDNKDALTGETIDGVEEVYRFFNRETGAHLYTMDETEKNVIQTSLPNYDYEEVAYYAFEVEPDNIDTIPVYRMLNNNSGAHLYSIDEREIANIQDTLPHFSMENGGNAAFYVMEL